MEAMPPAVAAVGAGVITVAEAHPSGVVGWQSEADTLAAVGIRMYNVDAIGSGTLVPSTVVRG